MENSKAKLTVLVLIILLTVVFVLPQKTFSASNSANQKTAGLSANLEKTQINLEYDNRAKILKKYLERYNSPIVKDAETFVKEADKNKIDWRLATAIAGVESTFGRQIPLNSYNAWGWGIYGNNCIYFKSFEEGIVTISEGLKENYIDKLGGEDVYEIGRIYAASPTWAQRVMFFMNQIEDFRNDNPIETLSLSL